MSMEAETFKAAMESPGAPPSVAIPIPVPLTVTANEACQCGCGMPKHVAIVTVAGAIRFISPEQADAAIDALIKVREVAWGPRTPGQYGGLAPWKSC